MSHSILVIDDDPQVLKMLDQYLGKTLGYQVVTVSSGEAAIEAALEKDFHLCIIDVHLPGITGAETYTRLRAMRPDVEAIFFTADQDFERGMDFVRFSLPPERVLKKPLASVTELTKLIINVLGPPQPVR